MSTHSRVRDPLVTGGVYKANPGRHCRLMPGDFLLCLRLDGDAFYRFARLEHHATNDECVYFRLAELVSAYAADVGARVAEHHTASQDDMFRVLSSGGSTYFLVPLSDEERQRADDQKPKLSTEPVVGWL